MTIKLIKEATKVFADVSGVGANGINLKTFLDKAEDGNGFGMGAATIVRWALINQNNILKK